MVGWRKRKLAKINAARELVYVCFFNFFCFLNFPVQAFLRDIGGVSDRTQKVYRYRARVVKLQKYLRSYIQCQQARVLVTSLTIYFFTSSVSMVSFPEGSWEATSFT
jgi:hypothetical protein